MHRGLKWIVIEPNSESAFPKALAMGEPTMDFFSKKKKKKTYYRVIMESAPPKYFFSLITMKTVPKSINFLRALKMSKSLQ